ncbi:MAG TPA: hypothetical protein VKU41_32330 [Polyangiaceae bacterium]|nr:hypothetical protein [Polyangiaceae bacterium]
MRLARRPSNESSASAEAPRPWEEDPPPAVRHPQPPPVPSGADAARGSLDEPDEAEPFDDVPLDPDAHADPDDPVVPPLDPLVPADPLDPDELDDDTPVAPPSAALASALAPASITPFSVVRVSRYPSVALAFPMVTDT